MNERCKKRQLSLARWNVADVVASKLAEKNEKSNCICWKVISFSWLQPEKADLGAKSSLSNLSLDEWLRYKLIPARKEEAEDDLVISAPGLSVWKKWGFDLSGDLRCYFSVIKGIQPKNPENLVGVNAILFPISHTLPWKIQKAELDNLVTLLPTRAHIPLLIITDFGEKNLASIVDEFGLNYLDKSRISRFMVICLNEDNNAQFHGYYSDEKLKEGLMWLASESQSQPVLFSVTIRELVSLHLTPCLDALDLMGDKVGPHQCISAFNQALDQSINDINTAADTNPTGWPCPEIFLLDDSTAESRAVKQFLPSLGWSSFEETEPLISALRNCKLPCFSNDISFLSRNCSTEEEIEDQKQLLQDCLLRYLTQSSCILNMMMATKETHLMVQKYTRLELHDTQYKMVPNWVLIFRRMFNWQLNSSGSFSRKCYVLEHSFTPRSPQILSKLELEASKPSYIAHPSLDEMVEVSCSPIVSKRVRSSPKGLQKAVSLASNEGTSVISMPDFIVKERNQSSEIEVVDNSDIHLKKNDMPLVPEHEKVADRLSLLLDQCNILQDEIDKKLSFYF